MPGLIRLVVTAGAIAELPLAPAGLRAQASPATGVVERSSFGPLSRVKSRYPQAKL